MSYEFLAKNRCLKSLILILTLKIFGAHSFENDEILTLESAKKFLREKNMEIAEASSLVDASNSKLSASRGAFLPQLDYSLGVAKDPSESFQNYSSSLTLSQNLFRGFSDWHNAASARLSQKIAVLNQRMVLQGAMSELYAQFGKIVFARDSLKLAQSYLARRKDTQRMIELRYKNGHENFGSALLAKANLAQSEIDFQEAEIQLNQAAMSLKTHLGLSPDSALVIDSQISFEAIIKEFPRKPVPPLELLAIKKFELELASQEKNLAAAKSVFYPSLNVSYGISQSGLEFYPSEKSSALSARLSLNLFNGTQDYHNFKRVKANALAQEIRNSHEKQKTKLAYEQLFENFNLLMETQKAIELRYEAVKVRLEIARKKYQNGLLSFDEFDRVETEFIEGERKLLGLKFQQVEAGAALFKMIDEG